MKKKTLYDIMMDVLRENGGFMYLKDLAEVIRKSELYTQKDGTPLKDGQINARVSNRPDLFVLIDHMVHIKAYCDLGSKAPAIKDTFMKPKENEEKSSTYEVNEIDAIIQKVTSALGIPLDRQDYIIIDRGMPHIPKGLPVNWMGVYCFLYNESFLKIGKAGLKSSPRFLSQHYNPNSAKSTLARSILEDQEMLNIGVTSENIKEWIKQNCQRIDILIDGKTGIFTLELIEAILHYKYRPRYEGFKTQR